MAHVRLQDLMILSKKLLNISLAAATSEKFLNGSIRKRNKNKKHKRHVTGIKCTTPLSQCMLIVQRRNLLLLISFATRKITWLSKRSCSHCSQTITQVNSKAFGCKKRRMRFCQKIRCKNCKKPWLQHLFYRNMQRIEENQVSSTAR